MAYKYSPTLLAVLTMIAAPAFAQDTAPGTPIPEAAPGAQEAAPTTQEAVPADAQTPATGTAPVETPAPAAGTPAAPADAPASDASTTGAPATPAPATEAAAGQNGTYYQKSEHQDWTLRCINTDQAKDPCELYQLLRDAQGNSVAEIMMVPLTNGDAAAGATLVAPLETDLIDGLGLAIDSAKPRGYPFSVCTPVGCVSRIGFTKEELAALKRGNKVTVSLRPFGANANNPVSLDMSLKGFTAGFDDLAAYIAKPSEAPAETTAPAAN